MNHSGRSRFPLARYALALLLVAVSFASVLQVASVSAASTFSFAKGITYPSYYDTQYLTADSDQSIAQLAATGATWIGLQTMWAMDTGTSNVVHSFKGTATDEALVHAITLAHSLGLKVLLRLHLLSLDNTSWKSIEPTNWSAWFQSYTSYMVYYAKIAQANGVEEMLIGCELDTSVFYATQWISAIAAVRGVYSGLLTYGASASACISGRTPSCQDGFRDVTWWNALDFAGVDSYFAIESQPDSSVNSMIAGCVSWMEAFADLQNWQASINKPVQLVEFGYPSYKGSPMNPGKELQKVQDPIVDIQEQTNAYAATFQTFYGVSWLKGMFWFRWEKDPTAGGLKDWSYTPQNKPAQQLITQWYAKNWDTASPTTTLLTTNPLPICSLSESTQKLVLSKSTPKNITVYVELPPGYNPASIVLSSVKINGVVPAIAAGPIGDFDNNYIPDTSFIFSRQALQAAIGSSTGEKTLTITGSVGSIQFSATFTITVTK